MSFWATIPAKIVDLDAFERACRTLELNFDRGELVFRDQHSLSYAKLVEKDGAYQIYGDVDAKWSKLAARLGEDYGQLVQQYAYNVIAQEALATGGAIVSEQVYEDGTIRLYVKVGE